MPRPDTRADASGGGSGGPTASGGRSTATTDTGTCSRGRAGDARGGNRASRACSRRPSLVTFRAQGTQQAIAAAAGNEYARARLERVDADRLRTADERDERERGSAGAAGVAG